MMMQALTPPASFFFVVIFREGNPRNPIQNVFAQLEGRLSFIVSRVSLVRINRIVPAAESRGGSPAGLNF